MEKIKFGTDGWRAVIADKFTFNNVRLVALAIAEYLMSNNSDKRGIFIGYDNRFLSEEFSKQAGLVLAGKGFKVYIANEPVPTPVTAFMVNKLNLDGAVMITASHNPPEYNGIKFIPDYAGPAEDKITKEVENNLNKLLKRSNIYNLVHKITKNKDAENNIYYISDFSGYIDRILSLIDKDKISKSKPKICVDTMFGAGSKILPFILGKCLNIDIKVLNNYRDPLFGGKLPDPGENNLKQLKKIVLENNMDLGIALDGDADRFGVIDGKGFFINPNNIISLILYYLLKTKKYNSSDMAVRTVATTHLIDEICNKNNIKILETPVGFKYIAKEMLNGNVIIGGEESGGLSIKGHIPEKDGILAGLLLVEIASFIKKEYDGIYLSDYLNKIYEEFGTYYNTRLDIEINMDKKDDVLEYFSNLKGKMVNGKKVIRVIKKDGIKLIFENKDWMLARPSGTEPLIRCYIESTNKNNFKTLKEYIDSSIQKIVS